MPLCSGLAVGHAERGHEPFRAGALGHDQRGKLQHSSNILRYYALKILTCGKAKVVLDRGI